MLERTASGEHLIAYNIFGSYARLRQKKDPNLGVVLPADYTLIASRVAFVPKAAKHPNAGKLFLDYLLSKRGQKVIADGDLYSIRDDVEGEATAGQVKQELGASAKPIPVSDELLAMLDQQKRLEALKKWQEAMRAR
jgi:iron(III) transport system substrate-binding protein